MTGDWWRPKMSQRMKTLHGFQRKLLHDLQATAHEGRAWLGLCSPVGSGKTTIVKSFALESDFRLVVVLAPLRAIARDWGAEDEIDAGQGVRSWRATEARSSDLRDALWWTSARGSHVGTHALGGREPILDFLRSARPDLRGVLVVVDEAHHAGGNKTRIAELGAMLRELGATVLGVTATPWRADGEQVFGPEVAVARLSAVEYAQQTDAHGVRLAPHRWEVSRVFVEGAAASATEVVDDGRMDEAARANDGAKAYAEAIAQQWAKDGFPKVVVNLRRVAWARTPAGRPGPVVTALRRVAKAHGRPCRILDLVGDMPREKREEADRALQTEKALQRWEDSRVDVVLSCARMNEGTDWPPCSHVYNVGIPRSTCLVIQRWGRASRRKWKIAGYPSQWAERQVLRFFVRRAEGEVAEEAWRQHRESAMLLAAYVAWYEAAQAWAESVHQAQGGPSTAPRAPAGVPTDLQDHEVAKVIALVEQINRAGAGGLSAAEIAQRVVARMPALSVEQVKGALALASLGPEAAQRAQEETRRIRECAEREGRTPRWVREQERAAFAAVCDEAQFAHVMVSSARARDLVAEFSAEDAKRVVERLQSANTCGFPFPEDREGLDAFALEYGRRHFERTGKWPSQMDGEIEGIQTTWAALGGRLSYRYGASLREVFGRPTKAEMSEGAARAIAAWRKQYGSDPRHSAKSPEERKLARSLANLRFNRPDFCEKYRIPLRADLSDVRRRGHNRPQLTVGDVLVRVCVYSSSTEYTLDIGGDSGKALTHALRNAANPAKRGQSRGIGATAEAVALLCQVNSLARLKAERDADCWRLWLDGADAPDPRPWAEILASGDNKRVVRAERVAFLDWSKPGPPARRPWVN